MEKRPKSENELIQEGLERFLEQELRGVSLEREQKKNTSESKREQDLQVIMPDEQWQKPSQVFVSEDIGGLDLDFDEPVSVRSRSASHTGYMRELHAIVIMEENPPEATAEITAETTANQITITTAEEIKEKTCQEKRKIERKDFQVRKNLLLLWQCCFL